MSGKSAKKNNPGVREKRGLVGQPTSESARRDREGNPLPPQHLGSPLDGEVRDLLGNFSEQVGAYFG